jgi:hypothetical protein
MSTVMQEQIETGKNIEELKPNKDTVRACMEIKENTELSFTSIDELFRYLKS